MKIFYNIAEYISALILLTMKIKKPLFIAIVALDLGLTIFFLVISIIMLANTVGKTPAEIAANAGNGLIGYLQNHTTVYGLAFVVPLFVLLAGNIVGLVIFVKKTSKSEPAKLDDLSEEQKEALSPLPSRELRILVSDGEERENAFHHCLAIILNGTAVSIAANHAHHPYRLRRFVETARAERQLAHLIVLKHYCGLHSLGLYESHNAVVACGRLDYIAFGNPFELPGKHIFQI